MIDETRSQIPIWLLWARFTNDVVTLVAVVLDSHRIDSYRQIIESDRNVVQVRVEKSEANHLYHPEWDAQWEQAYGEEFLRAYRDSAVLTHTKELQRQRDDLLSICERFLALESREVSPTGQLGRGWGTEMPTRALFEAARAAIANAKGRIQ